MQIRLTVVDPLAPSAETAPGRAASCDVLVTAPAGTALAAITSALASAVSGDGAPPSGTGQPVLYAGAERLDAQRCTLGEPPLTDGAVLALGAPTDPEPHPEVDDAPTRLDVVAGPDAGGVHLLHGGRVEIGRSADADVPLDDPDVSRLHCAVTVAPDGRVSVADLDSTNGTILDGTRVGTRPVRFAPGALLRIGESALRLAPAGGPGGRLRTAPDGEGHVRVTDLDPEASAGPEGPSGPTRHAYGPADLGGAQAQRGVERGRAEQLVVPGQGVAPRIESRGAQPYDTKGAVSRRRVSQVAVTGTGSDRETHGGRPGALGGTAAGGRTGAGDVGPPAEATRTTAFDGTAVAAGLADPGAGTAGESSESGAADPAATDPAATDEHARATDVPAGSRRKGTPLRGTDVPPGVRKRGGLGAWARRLTGGRGEPGTADGPRAHDEAATHTAPSPSAAAPHQPETWPDPAALLLTALGPGPRLWERGPGHPEALTVRLGTADRAAPDGSGLLPAVPVTADLREVGALGLAGPRARLAGLARAVVAQLAALHSPDTLEIVLISADRSRSLPERTTEWSWLGWLPHLRPGHGQDCRLLVAYDREQATARTEELLRRLEETPHTASAPVPPAPDKSAARRPSWARDDDADQAPGFEGPYTVLLVDGDPGGADVREAVARLAHEGPRAGIHVVCLAETAPASPASPVTETYETACAASPAFRECGAVALLSGDVATALRLLRVARGGTAPSTSGPAERTGTTERTGHATADHTHADRPRPDQNTSSGTAPTHHGTPARHFTSHSASHATSLSEPLSAHPTGPVGHGTIAAVDAVSPAWAERFARALAPLRTEGAGGERHARVSAPLPQMARLLDELGLARATPASLMARWADAADDTEALGGRARAVLGAGPRGPVCADLVAEGPHLLIEGPAGSGRTELLRAVVASLAAAERPDRLSIVLMDGRDSVGTGGSGHGEGLRVCTDVPHVTTHLTANDPVRMREFAQSLSAELKRRAELLGRSGFAEWHTGRELSGRMVAQRGASANGDLDSPPSSTMRLRPAAARQQTDPAPPLPRLVVVVDDLDALVSPALGSPGRPSAGSVMRALEAVAREGEQLGVHLVAAAASGGRTAESEAARRAALRVTLDAVAPGPDEPAPGRGRLTWADGRTTAFQGGRVTGRIPRTATLRPTVVPLDWHRMGDPPARRPVRELGNGPTDLALLASALERAAREVAATEVPSLL
ncbi:FHA domain-containing protein [Streptomyces sp. NPDC046909]|uniref:FHA domain-containing protein n=1 Tax=Streptomyces sp. NPDC046909 TaxID=3155617 RepID=UPI0033D56FD0